ncbi:hypothetical protein ACFY8K_16935 [Streptomyces misionensis]|uniref:hypothetical protein n=1 Tax=Streptomyces misionensis TaxID=67331 RepID=UPI00369F05D9
MTDQQLDLDAIEARANAATPGPWGVYQYGGDSLIEIAADLEETGCGYSARRTVARFDEEPLDNDPGHREWTAEEDWAQVQADAAYIAAMPPETAKAMAAEIRRLRARVTELERPAVERQRNEIRQSFTALSAQASQDGDHEGAFSLDCQLREREEQWAREDAAVEAHVVADDSDDPEHADDRGQTA